MIAGVVTDSTGGVLADVAVTLTNTNTQRIFTTKTGSTGNYTAPEIEPGRYIVRFELKGFSTYEVPGINLMVGRNLKVDAQLQVGSTQQTVQVTEAAPLIDFSSTAVAHNVAAEEFDRLPKTRTFQSMALASPSVNSGEVEGGIQVNGASGAENQFNVDGISTNSLIEGHSRQNASFEILQEVQVKTGGTEAQFGGALGGVINAITKSGGNAFHGDAHYYYSGSALSAGPVKRLFMDPSDLLTTSYQQDYKNPIRTHEVGYSIGGYFIKNQLYFFSAASPQFQERERKYLTSDNKEITLKEDFTGWQAYNKLSWDPTKRLRTNLGFLWSPRHTEGVMTGYTGYGNRTTNTYNSMLPNLKRGSFSPQSNYSGSIDYTVSNTMLVSVRGARFWDNFKALGIPNVSAVEWGEPSTNLPFAVPAELRQAKGYTNTPRTRFTEHDLATRTLLHFDVSKFFNFFGSHDLRGGLGRQKNVNNVNDSYPGGGYVTLFWNSEFEDRATGKRDRGTYGYYTVDDIGTKGSTGGTIDDFYIQDRWRIKRLSLDVGVRFENEKIPSFRRDIRDFAFDFGWGMKVAPRLGASYDVFGDGKLKVYGSWGMFYDWVKYELSRGTFGGDVWRTTYRSLDTLDVLSLSGTNTPGRNLWQGGAFQDWRKPAFGSDQLDPNIKPMSADITNIGTEYQINPQTVVAARYTRNHLRQAIEDVGTLDADGSEVYLYGNPGQGLVKQMARTTLTAPFDAPRPRRDYNALELSVTRRFAKGWFASASYVYSRLRGNYAGLASSDEVTPPATNRVSATSQQSGGSIARPGSAATRYYDLDYVLWDSHGNLDVNGPLATDRPHVFKLYGSYTFKFGTEIGGFFYAGSGTPVSTYVNTTENAPVFAEGRGDMGRTPVWNKTDLMVAHEVKLGESKKIRFEFNADNVFNQKTSRFTYNYYNRYRTRTSGMSLAKVDLAKGYDWKALVAGTADAKKSTGALDPLYGMEDLFNPGFAGRFGVKFIF